MIRRFVAHQPHWRRLFLHRSTRSVVGARRYYHELSYRETGDPLERLFYQSRPDYIPEPPSDTSVDWVLVELMAAPSNPADLNVVEGKYPLPHGKDHKDSPLPNSQSYIIDNGCKVGGAEGLGRVLEIKKNLPIETKFFKICLDDHVVLAESGWGTWRSHIWVPSTSLLRVPKEIMELSHNNNHWSIPQVSLISQVAGTAYRLLMDFADIQPGDIVLQNAGTSAVSMCAAELMRIKFPASHLISFVRRKDDSNEWPQLVELLTRGGTTRHQIVPEETALAAAEDKEAWRAWKAQHVPDGRVVLGLNSVHGPQTSRLFFPLLADGSSLVTYGAMSKQSLPVPAAPLIFRDITVRGYWHSRWMVKHRPPLDHDGVCPRQAMLNDLCHAIVENGLRLPAVSAVDLAQSSQGVQRIFHQQHDEPVKPKLVWNLQV